MRFPYVIEQFLVGFIYGNKDLDAWSSQWHWQAQERRYAMIWQDEVPGGWPFVWGIRYWIWWGLWCFFTWTGFVFESKWVLIRISAFLFETCVHICTGLMQVSAPGRVESYACRCRFSFEFMLVVLKQAIWIWTFPRMPHACHLQDWNLIFPRIDVWGFVRDLPLPSSFASSSSSSRQSLLTLLSSRCHRLIVTYQCHPFSCSLLILFIIPYHCHHWSFGSSAHLCGKRGISDLSDGYILNFIPPLILLLGPPVTWFVCFKGWHYEAMRSLFQRMSHFQNAWSMKSSRVKVLTVKRSRLRLTPNHNPILVTLKLSTGTGLSFKFQPF